MLVLAIIAALSFSVFSFSETTLSDYEAMRSSVDQIQLRAAAASGIAAVRARLAVDDLAPPPRSGLVVREPGESVSYTIVATLDTAADKDAPVLFDESARFNPNSLSLKPSRLRESRERLLALPGLTPDIASGLLSWMSRPDGFTNANPATAVDPDEPPRRRFRRLDELLEVSGLTPALLYGADRNANGVRDPDEPESQGGRLDRGLAELMTVTAWESTIAPTGEQKIDLNRRDLAGLYDTLRARMPREIALFVVASRCAPLEYDNEAAPRPVDAESERLARLDSAAERLRRQLGPAADDDAQVNPRDLVRDGLPLPIDPPFRLESLVSLAGGKIQVRIADEDRLLRSPWAADAGGIERLLAQLEPIATVVSGPGNRHEGRINIQFAPLPVLRTIPGMSESLARAILARRRPLSRDQQTIAWLARESLVTPAELRRLAPSITVRGSVWSGVALGLREGRTAAAPTAFVVARRGPTTDLLQQTDLPMIPFSSAGSTPAGGPTR